MNGVPGSPDACLRCGGDVAADRDFCDWCGGVHPELCSCPQCAEIGNFIEGLATGLVPEPDASTLRDSMRAVAFGELGMRDNFFGERSDPVADAILAMPEMLAIRSFLRDEFERYTDPAAIMRHVGLPESVAQWVLS